MKTKKILQSGWFQSVAKMLNLPARYLQNGLMKKEKGKISKTWIKPQKA